MKGGTGAGTRALLSVRVLLNVLLAAACAATLTWLADRPSLRVRLDMTSEGLNSFDERTRDTIDRLPAQVELDVFFRPAPQPLTRVVGEVQERMFGLLQLAQEHRPERFKLRNHNLLGAVTEGSPVEARKRELGVTELNVFVVSLGERRVIVPLMGRVAEIDLQVPPGNPRAMPNPRVASFRGEEALVEALLRVTQEQKPLALFSWGHGEPDLYGTEGQELGRLESALIADGFRTLRWDSSEGFPADCAVLAIVAPREPLSSEELESVRDFVDRGGRLIAVAGTVPAEEEGSVSALLASYGIAVGDGFVCRPLMDPTTGRLMDGSPKCADLLITAEYLSARHPVTESLYKGERRVRVSFTRPLARGRRPAGGVLTDLCTTSELTWADRLADGPDFELAEGEEVTGPFTLAMVSRFSPPKPRGDAPIGVVRDRPESRVLGLGSQTFLTNALFATNRDFALNAFNWAASREFRVNISARDPEERVLALGADGGLFRIHLVCSIGLPILCLLLGLGVTYRRRRS